MTVQFEQDRLVGLAGNVERLAAGAAQGSVRRGADVGTAGMAGSGLCSALADAGAELVLRADRFDESLWDWARSVRVGGEVFAATDRLVGASRAVTGVQVAR